MVFCDFPFWSFFNVSVLIPPSVSEPVWCSSLNPDNRVINLRNRGALSHRKQEACSVFRRCRQKSHFIKLLLDRDRSARPAPSFPSSNLSEAIFFVFFCLCMCNECLPDNFELSKIQVREKRFQEDTICFSLVPLICSLIASPLWFTAARNALPFRYQPPGRDRARYQNQKIHHIHVCRDKALHGPLSNFHIFPASPTNPSVFTLSAAEWMRGFSSWFTGSRAGPSWGAASQMLRRRRSQVSFYVGRLAEKISRSICETRAAAIHYL